MEALWGVVPYVLFALAILVIFWAYKEEVEQVLRLIANLCNRARRK